MLTRWTRILAAGAACFAAAQTAHAQAYPSRPVRFVVPYVPGGGVDFVGRTVAQKLSQAWNHPVVVDNRPGAGTNIGSEMVAKSPPDGYTLLVCGVPNTVNMTLFKNVPYDVEKDFAPVVRISTAPNILVVHPSLPARSVKELITLAKTRPAQLTYASAGYGSSNHLSGELFRMMAGVNVVHVPYKGGGAAITDILAGQVTMYFGTTPSTAPHVLAGKLRGLGLTGSKRSALLPNVPTVAEAGLPGYEQSAWHGLLAPAGTPENIVSKLNTDVMQILRAPDLAERFSTQGVEIVGGTPAEFSAFIRQDVAKYRKLLEGADIRVD